MADAKGELYALDGAGECAGECVLGGLTLVLFFEGTLVDHIGIWLCSIMSPKPLDAPAEKKFWSVIPAQFY